MPTRLRKCSSCNKHTFVLTAKECSHCGEEFEKDELPQVQNLSDVLPAAQESQEQEETRLFEEEQRNLRWAKRDQARQPARTIIIEEIEERFPWISIPFFPSLFSGIYTEGLLSYGWLPSIILGAIAGLAYFFIVMISTDLIYRRLTGYLSIATHWFAWAWFYYWTYERGSMLSAFLGPWLFLSMFGRLIVMWDFLKNRKL